MKTKKEFKNKIGRKERWTTHIEPHIEYIKGLCRRGFTEEQIAKKLNISYMTFRRYKQEKEQLFDALKETKDISNAIVENSLFKRANGYEFEEVTQEKSMINGKEKLVIKKTKKHIPPDSTAMIFWLKNRMPDVYRDKKDVDIKADISHQDIIKYIYDEEDKKEEDKS